MKIGLALGGGGARALAHIGILKVLQELGVKVDCIAGTSMGAVIGGLYALEPSADKVETTIRRFLEENKKEILSLKGYVGHSSLEEQKLFLEKSFSFVKELYLWNLHIVRPHLANPKPFFTMIRGLFGNRTFGACRIPFLCVAVDIMRGKPLVINRGLLFKGVMASCTLPGIFPCVRLKDKVLVDGGVLLPLPASLLRGRADVIIGVDVDQAFVAPTKISSALDVLFTVDRIRYKQIVETNRKTADFLFHPDVSSYLWDSFSHSDEIIAQGYREASRNKLALSRLLRKRRLFSLIGIRKVT